MVENAAEVSCPFCGSQGTRRNASTGRIFGRVMWLIGIPLPIKARTWYCFDCRKEFLPKKAKTTPKEGRS